MIYPNDDNSFYWDFENCFSVRINFQFLEQFSLKKKCLDILWLFIFNADAFQKNARLSLTLFFMNEITLVLLYNLMPKHEKVIPKFNIMGKFQIELSIILFQT